MCQNRCAFSVLPESLRQGSYNRALLRAAKELAPASLSIEIFDLEAIPLYNADVEAKGDPAPVAAFKSAIGKADGLLMATPEYNHGVPGVMKNAFDWASRPPRAAVLSGKPVGLIGASPGMTGTARGQSQLRQAFETDIPRMNISDEGAVWYCARTGVRGAVDVLYYDITKFKELGVR